jgi:hypothetical protein
LCFISFCIPSFKTISLYKMEQSATCTTSVITVARSGFLQILVKSINHYTIPMTFNFTEFRCHRVGNFVYKLMTRCCSCAGKRCIALRKCRVGVQ